ncbi:MAG: ubiquitin-like domain-containing protein [Candidatus Saccharimonadia bacterium]
MLGLVVGGLLIDRTPLHNLALADTHRIVSISVDGNNRIVTTDAGTVGAVLARAGISITNHDLAEPSVSTKIPVGFFNINVFRSQAYYIVDGAHGFVAQSAQQSPKLIATDAGLKLYPEDTASVEMVSNFVANPVVGRKLVIDRATPVTILVDGTTLNVRSHATTVGDVLNEKGVRLGANDTVNPNGLTHITNGMTINVTRVADVTITEKKVLPYATTTTDDPNMLKGSSIVVSPGTNGSEAITYHVHYENGIEMYRNVLAVADVVNPLSEALTVGTKVVFAGSVEYWRPYVTAAATQNNINPNLMMAIMSCESHGNAAATNNSGPGHYGLFQYDPQTWAGLGGTMSNIYDGPTQISRTALKISLYGTSPWNASKFCWAGSY